MTMDWYRGNHERAVAAASMRINLSSTILPWDFVPGNRDVICGKAAKQHSGNIWCRSLVAAEMQIYQEEKVSGVLLAESNASTNPTTSNAGSNDNFGDKTSKKPPAIRRRDKTEIVSRVVRLVKSTSPRGGFVKMDSLHRRWVQVPDEQACRKVLAIMQDVMESRRHLSRDCSGRSRSPSNPNMISVGGLSNQSSFLNEYVAKQTAALKDNALSLFSTSVCRSPKRRRVTISRNRDAEHQVQVSQEDLQLQSFLGSMAAGMPEIVVDNPFEPNPIDAPNQAQPPADAFYASAVARLFGDLVPGDSGQGRGAAAQSTLASIEPQPGPPPPSPDESSSEDECKHAS